MMRVGISLFALLLLPVAANATDYVPACPNSLEALELQPAVGQSFNCVCARRPANEISDVWGTDIYTADSDVCAAAQHAGATRPGQNNMVRVTVIAGCDAYEGSSSNGVTSSTFESYSRSFYFPGYGDNSEAVNCKNSEADLPPPPPAVLVPKPDSAAEKIQPQDN